IFCYVFQSPWPSAVETETLRDNFCFSGIKHFEQSVHFAEQILVAQQFKWSLRLVITDDLGKLCRVIFRYRGIERSRTNADTLEARNFFAVDAHLFTKCIIGRLAAELVAHLE